MKLVVFETGGAAAAPGLLLDGGVVSLAPLLPPGAPAQAAMQFLIDQFAALRPAIERLTDTPVPLERVRLLAPLPWPGKLVCSTATYADSQAEPAPLLMTLKSAESVIGQGATIHLPEVGPPWQFVPEAELGLVVRGPAHSVAAADWQSVVFGYTCVVDVMARGDTQFGRDFWLAKADTLGPLGPCIVTADEIEDPRILRVTSRQNGKPRQDYSMADGHYSIGDIVEFATTVLTLQTGDVLACGTSPQGLEPIADGDNLAVTIDGVGRLELGVAALAGAAV